MTEWQPIETAPKDGTIIIIPDAVWGVIATKWMNHNGINAWWTRGRYLRHPLYWMPLPEPPK